MSWSNDYVGTPFLDLGRSDEGCDCWGLASLVYARELKIALPCYSEAYASTTEDAEISELLKGRNASPWLSTKTASPARICSFDLLLFRRGSADTHIGIAVNDRIMLHMALGDSAKVESHATGRWAARFVGAYRHEQKMTFKHPLNGMSQ